MYFTEISYACAKYWRDKMLMNVYVYQTFSNNKLANHICTTFNLFQIQIFGWGESTSYHWLNSLIFYCSNILRQMIHNCVAILFLQ